MHVISLKNASKAQMWWGENPVIRILSATEMLFKWFPIEVKKFLHFRNITNDIVLRKIPRGTNISVPYMTMSCRMPASGCCLLNIFGIKAVVLFIFKLGNNVLLVSFTHNCVDDRVVAALDPRRNCCPGLKSKGSCKTFPHFLFQNKWKYDLRVVSLIFSLDLLLVFLFGLFLNFSHKLSICFLQLFKLFTLTFCFVDKSFWITSPTPTMIEH